MTLEATFHGLFWVLFAAVLVMRFIFVRQLQRTGRRIRPDKQAIQHEGKGIFAFRLAGFVLMIVILFSYALNLPWLETFHIPWPEGIRWAGFALGLVSIGFWTWTQATLGQNWSPQLRLGDQHRLITNGPYAQIRHPMYTSIFGFGFSLALVSANWVFVALALLVIAGLIARAPREEQMLIEAFGDEYRAYQRRTGRFFPRLG